LLAGFALVWCGIDLRAHSQTAHGTLIGGQDQTGGQGHSHRTATLHARRSAQSVDKRGTNELLRHRASICLMRSAIRSRLSRRFVIVRQRFVIRSQCRVARWAITRTQRTPTMRHTVNSPVRFCSPQKKPRRSGLSELVNHDTGGRLAVPLMLGGASVPIAVARNNWNSRVFEIEGQDRNDDTHMPPPTSKAEQFRARADACVKQAENCSTELEKTHWMTLAEDWLKMAQDELPLRSHRRQ
jgi:hypothetical protein